MNSKFHVNPVTGNTGACRARWECPFGGDDAHFDTEKEARDFFESMQTPIPLSLKKTVRVFRVGSLEAPQSYFPDLERLLDLFDKFTPEGRHPRKGALFASPDMDSHFRWVKGNDFARGDTSSHELTVNPDTVYVYPIDIYEAASSAESMGRMSEFTKLTEEYWKSGMTLREWQAWSAKTNPKPGTWEILLPPHEVKTVRPVSNRRIIESAPESTARELNWILEPRRASKGLLWRKTDDTSSTEMNT